MTAPCKKLVYKKNGHPPDVIMLVEEQVSTEIKPGETLVKVLYSPINPSDILTVQGHYPFQPPGGIPGFEGVVEIVKGTSSCFKTGDRALVRQGDWGMWKQFGIVEEKYLNKMPKELPVEAAATLIINPCTAYLMMKHIVELKPGDAFIQNAANSSLGKVIIQLAKAAGITSINVIRSRPNLAETVEELKALGADHVITDVDLKKFRTLGLPEPKLALECIGGSASLDLAASLCIGGTMANYGSLSLEPVHVWPADLQYRSITVRGFWLSQWSADHPVEFAKVIDDVMQLYIDDKLKLPKFRKFPLEQWKEAVSHAMKGFTNEKILIQFN